MRGTGGVGYDHHFDCGDGLMSVYICQKLPNCTLVNMQFIACELYLHNTLLRCDSYLVFTGETKCATDWNCVVC